MRAIDILWYLLGRKDAIRRVAASRVSLYVGLLLVMMAGIAREYDQTYIPEFGIRFLFPVISSFVAAAIIYAGLMGFLLPKRMPPNPGEVDERHSSFRCFLSLFWMTAPLAWVYAFPAEHLYSPREAAWINVVLLAFVATTRVLLLSRVLSVLLEIYFLRVLSSVTCISAVIMAAGSIGTSMSLVQIMGGLRYSPEDAVSNRAAEVALGLSFYGFLFFAILNAILARVKKEYRKDLPVPTESTVMPVAFLMVAFVAWILALIPQQQKLSLNYNAQALLRKKDYAGMLAYLSSHNPADFNKVHRLPPDPYKYAGLSELPEVIKALNGTEAPWVRVLMLDNLDVALRHRESGYSDPLLLSLDTVMHLPDGEAWIRIHAKSIEDHFKFVYYRETTSDLQSLAEKLKTLGVKIELPEKKP